MSIKKATKLTKFLTIAGISFLVGVLFLELSKKQEYNYMSLLDFNTDSAHADAAVVATGSGDGSGDGNDSGSGDGC